MGVGREIAPRVESAKAFQLLLPLLAPLPSQACTRKIKLAKKSKKRKRHERSTALPGDQQGLDPGH